MSLSGRIFKSIFRLSAEAFEQMAGERYGFQEDMGQTWLGFKPVAETLVAGFHLVLVECIPIGTALHRIRRGWNGPDCAGCAPALEEAVTGFFGWSWCAL